MIDKLGTSVLTANCVRDYLLSDQLEQVLEVIAFVPFSTSESILWLGPVIGHNIKRRSTSWEPLS